VVQLHEILAMSKKVHFMLDLAANGKLFSLMDSSENLLLDESGNLKVADFGLGVAASSSEQHLRSRKLVNPRGIWN
jgi:carbon catabolite-derepressing protein kinase